MTLSTPPIHVAALYRFCPLPHFQALRSELAGFCGTRGIKGSLLLASEGLNGTVAGGREAIGELIAFLEAIPGVGVLEVKYSSASAMPFHRMKVRLKREIVTMGVADLDPPRDAGAYVEPEDWNALISDPATIVIDTRNDYEIALGAFEGAVSPGTKTFRDFPAWARDNCHALAERKVAMYCTGGIRCEKATTYLRSIGVLDVHHLKGGILKYLETVPAEASLWRGECFVFDERVSVGHGLLAGEAELCRACRHPLSPEDRRSPAWQEGVSCAHCLEIRSDEDRARYAERQQQVKLAQERGLPLPIGGS